MTQSKGQMRGHRRLYMIMHRINGNICTQEKSWKVGTHMMTFGMLPRFVADE